MALTQKGNGFKKLRDLFRANARSVTMPSQQANTNNISPPAPTNTAQQDAAIQKEFFSAIRMEDMDKLKDNTRAHPEAVTWVESHSVAKSNGLLVAAQHDCPKAAAHLCEMNTDTKATDSTGCTALIIAAGGHFTAVVDVLLTHKADLEVESNLGDTALLAAMRRFERLQHLAKTHPDMVPQTNYDTVRKLVTAGADPHRKNKHGENAFSVADKIDDKELYLALLGADQERRDNADIQSGKKPVIRIMRPLRINKH